MSLLSRVLRRARSAHAAALASTVGASILIAAAALAARASAAADEITVTAVGDVMPGSTWDKGAKLPGSVASLFAPAVPALRRGQVVFGNLEGVLLDRGGAPKPHDPDISYYVFRMPTRYAFALKEVGFNLLSTANNHVNDLGAAGRASTRRTLEQAGIPTSGTLDASKPWGILSIGGRRIGLLAFAAYEKNPRDMATHDLRDLLRASQLVRRLRNEEGVDLVIVSFHGGGEGRKHQRVPRRTEIYERVDVGDVYAFAHTVVDAGADLVLGSGPHVPRAMELYRDRLIAYSLGNFVTWQQFELPRAEREPMPVNALSPLLEATLDAEGRFVRGRIHSFIQLQPGGVRADRAGRAARRIRELSAADFPESELRIGDDGSLSRPR